MIETVAPRAEDLPPRDLEAAIVDLLAERYAGAATSDDELP
jgi:hypothetical protein